MNQVKIVKSNNNHRYIVVNSITGKILDDAQGYGYQSELRGSLISIRPKTAKQGFTKSRPVVRFQNFAREIRIL